MKLHPKYTSGLFAVTIYVVLIGLIFYYFAYRIEEKKTHFVAKNSHAIAVTLHAPGHKKTSHSSEKKHPPVQKKHTKPKPMQASKRSTPIKAAKKIIKKSPKKIKAKRLFSDIKPTRKPKKSTESSTRKHTNKPQRSRRATKKKIRKDTGVEHRYLATVQNKLYGWPPQSNFAGATLTIGLTIYPNGRFEYVVLTPSQNPDFHRTILHYLKQLQSVGFAPTPTGKKYTFKVEIIAK